MRRVSALALVSLAGLLVSCDDTTGNDDSKSAQDLVRAGWTSYEARDWSGAASKFRAAMESNASYGEAYCGLGWSLLELRALAAALAQFQSALDHGYPSTDVFSGRTVLLLEVEPIEYELAIAAARNALRRDPEYIFVHDKSLTWQDLRLIMAQAHFSLGRYVEANAQVDSVGGIKQDPNSASFVEDLLREIERLNRLFRS